MDRIRFGIIGTGARGSHYGFLLSREYREDAEVVALCDSNPIRLRNVREMLGLNAKLFTDYRDLLALDDVDAVIITTPDYTHAEIAIASLEAGKDVLCEKPIATTVKGCREVLDAVKRSDRTFMTGFVLRYNRVFSTIKKMVSEGEIGSLKLVTSIDNRQGADYFRRWHRFRKNSGGLLVHKSCHSLDVINWVVDSEPVRVSAFGGNDVYVPGKWRGERCLTCKWKRECPEYIDLRSPRLSKLYLEPEKFDGYIRDVCVWTSEKDTCDNATVIIEYANGVRATYTLCLFTPYTSRQMSFIGDGGKLEVDEAKRQIILYPNYSSDVKTQKIGEERGGHGGGDMGLINDFLTAIREGKKPLASAEAGSLSVLLGLAAIKSIREGRTIELKEME